MRFVFVLFLIYETCLRHINVSHRFRQTDFMYLGSYSAPTCYSNLAQHYLAQHYLALRPLSGPPWYTVAGPACRSPRYGSHEKACCGLVLPALAYLTCALPHCPCSLGHVLWDSTWQRATWRHQSSLTGPWTLGQGRDRAGFCQPATVYSATLSYLYFHITHSLHPAQPHSPAITSAPDSEGHTRHCSMGEG